MQANAGKVPTLSGLEGNGGTHAVMATAIERDFWRMPRTEDETAASKIQNLKWAFIA